MPLSACGTGAHSAALPNPFSRRCSTPFSRRSPPPFRAAFHPLSTPLFSLFPRRFATQARELWLVGGERSLLGKTVALEEFAGCSATGPPHPIVSHSPTDDHKKYGLSYLDMDTRAKFHCEGLCSVGVRMLAWSDETPPSAQHPATPPAPPRRALAALGGFALPGGWVGGGGGGGGRRRGTATALCLGCSSSPPKVPIPSRRSAPSADPLSPPPNHARRHARPDIGQVAAAVCAGEPYPDPSPGPDPLTLTLGPTPSPNPSPYPDPGPRP